MKTEIQPRLLEAEERMLSAMAAEAGLDARALSALQAGAREEALGPISLDDINDSLIDAASLLDVAFNALDKTEMQRRISSVRDDLDAACRNSYLLARQMESKLATVIEILTKCYGLALDGKEADAVRAFLGIAKPAAAAEALAKKLRALFLTLAENTTDAYLGTVNEKNDAYQRIEQIRKEVSGYKTEMARAEAEAAALTESINAYSQKYLDELASEKKARERQETLKTVKGFLAIASCMLMCTGIGLLFGLGGFTAIAATKGDPEAVRRHQKMAAEILTKKTEFERRQVEQLEKVRLFGEGIANLQSEQEARQLQWQNLYYASACLNRVAMDFNKLYFFWGQVRSYCEFLNSSASMDNLEDAFLSDAPIQPGQRQEIARVMLPCVAQWHTLHRLLCDYLRMSGETLDRLGKDMRGIPTGEAAFSFAKEKAARFLHSLNQEIAERNRKIQENETLLREAVQ